MSNTPETNALLKQSKIKGRNPDPWKLCRKLERERDEAFQQFEVAQTVNAGLATELYEWRMCAEKLAKQLRWSLACETKDCGCAGQQALREFNKLKKDA
jgi:hypothetical protein